MGTREHVWRRVGDFAISGVIIAVVVAVGASRLRSHASMWRDETWTWLAIHRSLAGLVGIVFKDEANMGPYYVALRIWSIFGGSDGWLRGFSIVGGACTAVALFVLVRRYFDLRAALLAVVLLVANPVFVHYLTETRAYSWSMAFAVGTTACLLRVTERRGWVVAYGVLAGIGVAINLVFVLVVGAQLIGVVVARGFRDARQALLGGAVAAVSFLPFLPVTIRRRNGLSWVQPVPGHELLHGAESVVGGHPWSLLLIIGIVLACAGLVRRRCEPVTVAVAAAVLPTPALMLISVVRPAFIDRYLSPTVPLACAAAAVGYASVLGRARWHAVGAVAAVAVWLFAVASPLTQNSIEDLRGSAQFLAANVRPGDVIVFYPTWSRAGLYRYWQPPRSMDVAVDSWPGTALFPIDRSTAALRTLLASRRRIWFVGYPNSTWHPRPDPLQPLIAGIRRRPQLASKLFGFRGPIVTLYGPPNP